MRAVVLSILLVVLLLACCAARSDAEPETITLTRAQIDQLEKQVEALMQKRERAAFEAVVKYEKQACPSLI